LRQCPKAFGVPRLLFRTAVTLTALATACVACAGSSSSTVTTTATATRHSEAATVATLPAAVDGGLPTRQVTLVGHLAARGGGYVPSVSVTDAERSLRNPGDGLLLQLRGGIGVKRIGSLHVVCGATPRSRFVFTSTARGEGPPRIYHESATTSDRTSISGAIGSTSGFTNTTGLGVPERHPGREIIDHYEMFLGGEAFQYSATITDLLVPTQTRCDLLAEATVVEHAAGSLTPS
jgi:hypothetical protein